MRRHAEPHRRFLGAWQRMVGSLWFFPGVLVLMFFAAGIVLVNVSVVLDEAAARRLPALFAASPQSARSVLSAISSSVITVAGVTFSVMVVAVSQASSQYTPRVLRNFMRDRVSQATLGMLCGVFVYSLVVLRTIRTDGDPFVPAIAVNVTFPMTFSAVALLMYFIHHISSTLEAGSIIASVSAETVGAVDKLFPEELGDEPEPDAPLQMDERWGAVAAPRTGYIQYVNGEDLLRLADALDCRIRMEHDVGQFVIEGQPIAWIDIARPDADAAALLREAFDIATFRTVAQDPGFGIRQIVDIALKALSPSMNDVTTAVTCVQYLTAIQLRLVRRRVPSPLRFKGGELRVIACGPSFAHLLDLSFDEIRRAAAGNARVLSELANSLATIFACARTPERRRHIAHHVARVRSTMKSDPTLERECEAGLAVCARVADE
jgi:uncharacterized membrane protein